MRPTDPPMNRLSHADVPRCQIVPAVRNEIVHHQDGPAEQTVENTHGVVRVHGERAAAQQAQYRRDDLLEQHERNVERRTRPTAQPNRAPKLNGFDANAPHALREVLRVQRDTAFHDAGEEVEYQNALHARRRLARVIVSQRIRRQVHHGRKPTTVRDCSILEQYRRSR